MTCSGWSTERLFLALFVLSACGLLDAQTCTVSNIRSIQPSIVLGSEMLDGKWFVSHVYQADGSNEVTRTYNAFTVDVVPTLIGLTLYLNKNVSGNAVCVYDAIELNTSSQPLVFSTAGVSNAATPQTVIIAAADDDVRHVLIYVCSGVVEGTQLCNNPTAFLAGRQFNVTKANNWLISVKNTSIPCFSDQPNVVQGKEVCPLKPFWPLPGRNCDVNTFQVQQQFDLNKYISRKWYEMAWLAPQYIDPSLFFQDYVHEYTLQANGSVVISISGRDQTTDECFFTKTVLTNTSTPGQLIFHDKGADAPYGVMETDYDHYAVVFGCVNMTSSNACINGRGWLWSRGQSLDRKYRVAANSKFQNICLNPAAFFPTEHNNPCTKDTSDSGTSRAAALQLLAGVFCIMWLTS